MEARFRPAQDTLTLLEALQGCWAQRPQGPEHRRPFFVGVTLRNLIPEEEMQAMLFEEPGNRNQLSATMDKLNLKYGHTTLHFAGMLARPRLRPHPHRLHPDPRPVRHGLDVSL
jgi:DNA polymerase-4